MRFRALDYTFGHQSKFLLFTDGTNNGGRIARELLEFALSAAIVNTTLFSNLIVNLFIELCLQLIFS